MRTAAEVQRMVAARLAGEFPSSPLRRYPDPPRDVLVGVRALTDAWCVDGQRVAVGELYRVPAGVAAQLEARGKAKLA